MSWTDFSENGPAGLYNLKFEPTPNSVCPLTASVEYSVEIVNECLSATFEIDSVNAVFLPVDQNSATHSFAQNTSSLLWTEAAQIIPSLNFCGTIVQEVYDASSGTDEPLNAAMAFSYTQDESALTVQTSLAMNMVDFVGQY